MTKALEGIKVLDFGWVQTAPRTVRFLSDYGAEVIKIESGASPDIVRGGSPASVSFANYNRNRYDMTLNLRHPRAPDITLRLMKWADIVVDNFTAEVMDRLGLGYKDLIKIKPDIIMVSMSNQGATGPRAPTPGYGSHLAAVTGIYNLLGWPDRGPVEPRGFYVDNVGPRMGFAIIMAALDYRRRTGKGQFIDFSQFESGINFMAPIYLDYAANKRDAIRDGNRSPYAAPHGVYRCQGDDRWCAIAVFNDKDWRAFCRVAGKSAWVKAAKFKTLLARKRNEDELDKLIEEWTVNYPPEEVMSKMQAAGVDAAVVQNSGDVLNNPQLKHRNYFTIIDNPEVAKQFHLGLGFRLSKTPAEVRMPYPELGEHTEHVCKKILGFSDEEFDSLLASDVFI